MAADLYIHVFGEITEDDLRVFKENTLGSKHFIGFLGKVSPDEVRDRSMALISRTVSVWIGEVSWIKANVTGLREEYVPNTVLKVHELIGEDLPVLDEALKQKILSAFSEPNTTGYRINKKSEVEAFLTQNIGKRLFTVSW